MIFGCYRFWMLRTCDALIVTPMRGSFLPRSYRSTPFSGQFRRQCMHFGNSAGNFGGSAVRRSVGHDSAAAMSKLVALLPNCMQIVQNWSEKGVYTVYTICKNLGIYQPRGVFSTVLLKSVAVCFYAYRPARHHVTMLWRDSTQCVGKA